MNEIMRELVIFIFGTLFGLLLVVAEMIIFLRNDKRDCQHRYSVDINRLNNYKNCVYVKCDKCGDWHYWRLDQSKPLGD